MRLRLRCGGRQVVLVCAWSCAVIGQPPVAFRGQPAAERATHARPVPPVEAPAQADAAVVFEIPEDGAYVSGPVTIRVRVDPPGTEVRTLSVFADGRLLCTRERPPFECQWDAGPKVTEHQLRAVAVLADGSRVARGVRTRGVAYTEAVDVDVVHITASVTDGSGRFVRGLPASAFRVFEDGVRQQISYFASENVPLEIIVAVDVSGSMTDAMPQVRTAVRKFLTALRPTDRVTLIGFNDNVFTLARPSVDLATRLRAVDRLAPWGGTALYDVIVQGIEELGRQPGRRVMVVFTDGEDLHSHIALATAERRLEGSDAVLYPIGQGRAPQQRSLKEILQRLAEKSGGRAFFEEVTALDAVFAEILEELSNQYLLGFVSTDPRRDNRWRTLRVELPGRSERIRARQGYRAVPR
ncbi:MAG: VWA domain-containing protein [Acidobacteriota bacterium]